MQFFKVWNISNICILNCSSALLCNFTVFHNLLEFVLKQSETLKRSMIQTRERERPSARGLFPPREPVCLLSSQAVVSWSCPTAPCSGSLFVVGEFSWALAESLQDLGFVVAFLAFSQKHLWGFYLVFFQKLLLFDSGRVFASRARAYWWNQPLREQTDNSPLANWSYLAELSPLDGQPPKAGAGSAAGTAQVLQGASGTAPVAAAVSPGAGQWLSAKACPAKRVTAGPPSACACCRARQDLGKALAEPAVDLLHLSSATKHL